MELHKKVKGVFEFYEYCVVLFKNIMNYVVLDLGFSEFESEIRINREWVLKSVIQ